MTTKQYLFNAKEYDEKQLSNYLLYTGNSSIPTVAALNILTIPLPNELRQVHGDLSGLDCVILIIQIFKETIQTHCSLQIEPLLLQQMKQ